MPEKFIVPQFIDKEDRILGPITVRQFLMMLGATFVLFVDYSVFKFNVPVFATIGLIDIALCGLFGFVKVNGQPFHIFFINFLQTSVRPKLRVWDKRPTVEELRAHIAASQIPAPVVMVNSAKPRIERMRLRDLTMVVNTGGSYKPEESVFASAESSNGSVGPIPPQTGAMRV